MDSCKEVVSRVGLSDEKGTLYRMVESQQQVASTRLTGGDLEAQSILEEMLEHSKPKQRSGTEHLDYLLSTPWRYPPLRYGSRFGVRTSPSMMYGGLSVEATLAEAAYYRFVFYNDMENPPEVLMSQHDLFTAEFSSALSANLLKEEFAKFQGELRSQGSYSMTQQVGEHIRDMGGEIIVYGSARSSGNCVALIEPTALVSSKATVHSRWQCRTTADSVIFSGRVSDGFTQNLRVFPAEQFQEALTPQGLAVPQ